MNVLHAGRLAKSKEDFKIIQLGLDDVEQVARMQQRVHQQMVNKSWFVCDSAQELEAMVRGGGALFGVLNQRNEMIASRVISTPGETSDNLALDLNVPIDLNQVVILESSVVDPAYRGNRLQSIMMDVAIRQAERRGYRHILSTVSPHNVFSLYNVMRNGLKIRALKKKYATAERPGVWRFILHKDLLAEEQAWARRFEIALDDFNLQKVLIDKGFYGDQVSRRSNTVAYAR